jgi:hypothetical protein
MTLTYLFAINFICTVFMTGVIWMVQLVHYPSFLFVDVLHFKKFHTFHSNRISWIVAPVMLLELMSAYFLVYYDSRNILNWIGLFLITLIFALTAFVSVPQHNKLSLSHDEAIIKQLIASNWYRTALWSVRFVLLGYMIFFSSMIQSS